MGIAPEIWILNFMGIILLFMGLTAVAAGED